MSVNVGREATLARLTVDDVGVIFHNLHDLVAVHEPVLDDAGNVVDAALLWWNRTYEIEHGRMLSFGQLLSARNHEWERALEHVRRAWFGGISLQLLDAPATRALYQKSKSGHALSVTWERVGAFLVEIGVDMTDSRELSMQLAEQGLALDAAIADRAKAMERARIARDLHDSVIQNIYAATLRLHNIAEGITLDTDEVRSIAQSLSDVISEIRTEIFEFNEDSPADLLPVLQSELAPLLGLGMMKISFRIGVRRIADHRLDRNVRLVIRETVTNALKHGDAERVAVAVHERDGNLVVEVTDDGHGIPADVARVSGLANLKMRAEELGGHMTVHSETGRGTTVTWSVPYRKETQ